MARYYFVIKKEKLKRSMNKREVFHIWDQMPFKKRIHILWWLWSKILKSSHNQAKAKKEKTFAFDMDEQLFNKYKEEKGSIF